MNRNEKQLAKRQEIIQILNHRLVECGQEILNDLKNCSFVEWSEKVFVSVSHPSEDGKSGLYIGAFEGDSDSFTVPWERIAECSLHFGDKALQDAAAFRNLAEMIEEKYKVFRPAPEDIEPETEL
jgi:hypothetical protein